MERSLPFLFDMRQSPRNTSTTKAPRKPRTARTRSRKAQPVAVRPMPIWQRVIVSLLLIVGFSLLFYWFAVRPYAYRWKPCYGFQAYDVCLPSRYTIHGLDLSHHQGRVDWDALAYHHNPLFPLRFVFIKATEGCDLADEAFDANFQSARDHGLIRGAYHYFNPQSDARRQADFFIQHVALQPGDLPPVLDVEERGRLSNEELQQRVLLWLNQVETHYKVTPMLYTGYKFRTKYLNDTLFNRYPFWIAHYYVDSVSYQGPWQFWQHTDQGRVPGIQKKVDLNIFRGSQQELEALTIHPL